MKRKSEFALGLIFTFSVIAFSQVSFAARCEHIFPSQGQATFYEHGNYKGACVTRNIGRYSNSKGIGIGNDKISSIMLGRNTQVRLCKDNNFKGGCTTYTKNTASIGGMNDKTSSAIIEKIVPTENTSVSCKPNADQIAVFEHTNYKGACAVLGVGNYKNSSEIGVANDTISSVLVGNNVAIVGFEHRNFSSVTFYSEKNKSIMYSDNDNPLKTQGQGDKITSIKVIKRNK